LSYFEETSVEKNIHDKIGNKVKSSFNTLQIAALSFNTQGSLQIAALSFNTQGSLQIAVLSFNTQGSISTCRSIF
jgi:hypothetical protein